MEFWLYDHSSNTRKTIQVEGDTIVIGRDAECDIELKGGFVARKHARITRKGTQLFVENISRSGTRVANREIANGASARLDFGDEIQIAQYSLSPIRPGKTGSSGQGDSRELQQRLVKFEQQVHAELLERMNLRITGGINKNDAAYTKAILEALERILDERASQLDEATVVHTVHTHLHRMVIAEVVRQCQGKVQTDYQADQRTLDPVRERAVTEIVAGLVDQMPLLFDPTSVNEDLSIAEEAFDDLFRQAMPGIARDLRQYLLRRTVSKDIHDIMFGLGPLQDLLEMANVNEIMVVGRDRIYVEKNGVIQPTTRSFFSDDILMSVIERIITPVGRRVDQSTPLVDARLPDGSRVNIIIAPLSLVGPCITIRKFSWIPFTIDDLIERGSLSSQAAAFLQGCVVGRKNIVISGGTGSGKTTLLNVLSAYARPTERIVTIEESAELRLPQPHVVALEGRPANVEGRGAYTTRELVRNALRMRPDRIIVGEVRGAEALDMLQAMNTGHDGSLSTLHSNTPTDAAKRLETMVLMAVDMPVRAIREQIVSAVDLFVQVARFANGQRRVTHISEVTTIDQTTGEILIEDVFVLRKPDQPRMRHTGYLPTFTQEMIERGHIDVAAFL
jgi:Flp pilus assembly CpaF family ATPase/pSer/pThr/pTyr-binding forkhead associated (FHA) protein